MEHMVKHTPASHASILVAHLGLEQSSLKRHLANSFMSFEPLFKPTLSVRPVQITLLKTATCVPPSPVLPLLMLIPFFFLGMYQFLSHPTICLFAILMVSSLSLQLEYMLIKDRDFFFCLVNWYIPNIWNSAWCILMIDRVTWEWNFLCYIDKQFR